LFSLSACAATASIVGPGGAIMQLLRQAGYGGRVVPVNPKGGAIVGYESVPSIIARQGGALRHHGASGRSDVQRYRGNGESGRAAGTPSGASRFRARQLFQFCDHSDSASSLNQKIVRTQSISVDSRVLHFCNFLWTCGYSMATIGHKRGGKRGASTE
jgi:hypothetical protein